MSTLLVVVAHPDDETFGCGSVLLHAAERGRTAVVCLTRGEEGENAGGLALGPGGLGEAREAELRSAAALLRVDQVEVLDYRDSGMSGDLSPGSLCAAPLAELVEVVADAIARHQPSVVVALDGSDGHRDHQRVREAVVAALPSDLPLYVSSLPRSLFHEWLRVRGALGDADTDLPEIGTPDEQLTTVLDTSRHYATRQLAIAEHRSQASPYEGLPADLHRRFLASDYLVRINPPWSGGDRESDLVGLDPSVG